MNEKEPLRSGENVWIPDCNTNRTVNEEIPYRSYNVVIPTGTMIRRNQQDIVCNSRENSPVIDIIPLEHSTSDETTQTQTNNVPIEGKCNPRSTITRSGRTSRQPVQYNLNWTYEPNMY